MSDEREILSRMGRYWVLPRDVVEYLIEQWEHSGWKKFKGVPPRSDGFESHVDYMEEIGVIGQLAAESIKTRYSTESDDEDREEPRSRRTMPPPAAAPRGRDGERVRSERIRYEPVSPIVERARPRNNTGKTENTAKSFRWPKIDRRIIIGGAVLVIILIVLGVVFAMRGALAPSVVVMTPLPPRIVVPTAIPAPTAIPIPTMSWDPGVVRAIAPVEQSALQLGVITPADWVLFFLMFVMSLALVGNIALDWGEDSEASGDQRWEKIVVAAQSSCGLIAGLLSGLIIAWTAKSNLGFLIGFALLSAIWAIAAIRITKDGSPLNAALVLAAAALAVRGVTELPVGFGLGSPWVGFYNVFSLMTLVSSMRFEAAALTLLDYSLLIAAIVVASIEALRRYDLTQAAFAAVLVIGAIVAGQLASDWVVTHWFDMSSPDKVLASQIAEPVLGWIFGVLISLGVLLILRGRKVSVRNTTIQIAEISGSQGVVNFIMLVTTASVVINLLAR